MSPLTGELRVLDARDPRERAEWLAAWSAWPAREVHAHPGYACLFASASASGRPLCALWRSREGVVLYPFLLRELRHESWAGRHDAADLVTPYGYGGPFVVEATDRAALARAFWDRFDAWARQRGVVAEFLRLSLFPERLLAYPGVVELDRPNVVRDLDLDDERMWTDFEHKVRKNVAQARRAGVTVEVDERGTRLARFLELYAATLDRRGAAREYYFARSFFEALPRELPGQFVYLHALAAGNVVSTELVLVSAESAYSFLGGTDERAFALRPNDLLKFEAFGWARSRGLRRFVLGGGADREDGILRYKRSFAPRGTVGFHVGRRVLAPGVYDELIRRRSAAAERAGETWSPRGDFFPAYRS